MKNHQRSQIRIISWLLSLLFPLGCVFGSTFNVKISPADSGSVEWFCDDPAGSGTFTGKGGNFPYTLNVSFITLTFLPATGGTIVKVVSDEGDETPYLGGINHNMLTWYGPSEGSKIVTVTFSGGAAPSAPTGVFGFTFPTNNPLVTAVADVTGNYTGVTPTDQRNYNIDVAQDEQGTLFAMGTSDGIVQAGSANALAANAGQNFGKISTVSGEPTAQLKASFTGTKDGLPASGSGAARGPVKLQDIGSGTNGVEGTGSYKAQVGDVPYTAKNEPIQLEVPASITPNLHKAWSCQLNITNKVVNGKSVTLASAQVVLPNGDTIVYPERAAKYSSTKGYSLTFKGGTNTTLNPPAVDKKSAVSIKGMTLVQQGNDWQPNGGTIAYQFLGQKGSAALVDFLAP